MALVRAVKLSLREVPFLTATVPLETTADAAADVRAAEVAGVPFVHDDRIAVVRGPFPIGRRIYCSERTSTAPSSRARIASAAAWDPASVV